MIYISFKKYLEKYLESEIMKYGDLITVLLIVGFLLSLGYSMAVNIILWPVTLILLVLAIIFVYKIWIEK